MSDNIDSNKNAWLIVYSFLAFILFILDILIVRIIFENFADEKVKNTQELHAYGVSWKSHLLGLIVFLVIVPLCTFYKPQKNSERKSAYIFFACVSIILGVLIYSNFSNYSKITNRGFHFKGRFDSEETFYPYTKVQEVYLGCVKRKGYKQYGYMLHYDITFQDSTLIRLLHPDTEFQPSRIEFLSVLKTVHENIKKTNSKWSYQTSRKAISNKLCMEYLKKLYPDRYLIMAKILRVKY